MAYEGREKMRREAVRAVIADQAVVDAAAEGCRPTEAVMEVRATR